MNIYNAHFVDTQNTKNGIVTVLGSSILSIVTLASTLFLTACNKPPTTTYTQINGETMGTSYHIRFALPQDTSQHITQEAIHASIDKELISFNNELSTWQDDSTISIFNQAAAGTEVIIGGHFHQVLRDSKRVYEQSQGAFDPTVKPIIELWGFGKEIRVDRLQNPPTLAERQQAKALIDFESIEFGKNHKGFMVKKTNDGVQIDFSAIAKGYGVDVIAGVLTSTYNINNYMVEIGGEIATSGVNAKGQGWQIAIDAPILHSGITDRKLIATIRQPVDEADKQSSMHLATSGNYRNSIVFDGVRYSHTIDPTTGNPVVGGADSVTVADKSVALADAWATALTAMPYKQALDMANTLDKAVLFVIKKPHHHVDDTDNNATKTDSDNSNDIDGNIDNQKNIHRDIEWHIVETDKMKALRARTLTDKVN